MPPWTTAKYALKGIWFAAIALAFTVLAALLVVQTVRIEGFKVWPIEVRGWKTRALDTERQLEEFTANVERAQVEAADRARRHREADERRYADIAEEADREILETETDALAAADAYIAAHRGAACVQRPTADRSAGGAAGTGAEDHRARIPPPVPPDPLVPVLASDVRACAGAVAYALEARSFVLELEAASASGASDGTE